MHEVEAWIDALCLACAAPHVIRTGDPSSAPIPKLDTNPITPEHPICHGEAARGWRTPRRFTPAARPLPQSLL